MRSPVTSPVSRFLAGAAFKFLIASSLLSAASAALVTFEVRGTIRFADVDFAAGTPFVGHYTFETTAGFVVGVDPTIQRQYIAIVAWDLSIAGGYVFGRTYATPNDVIALGNNTASGDRYIATMNSPVSSGVPLPSGRTLSFWQIDLFDSTSSGADLLADISLPGSPPNLALAQSSGGRLVFTNGNQPQLTITAVPEPGIAACLFGGVVMMFYRRRARSQR